MSGELATVFGWVLAQEPTLQEIQEIRDAARTVTSLDRPVGEEDTPLGDLLGSDRPPTEEEVEISLREDALRSAGLMK